MTRCELAARLLAGHAAGELEPLERAIVEDHLAECAGCRAELAREERLRELLGGLPTHRCPDRVTAAIEAAVDAETAGALQPARPHPRPSRWNAWSGGLATASLLAAAVLLALVLPSSQPLPETTGSPEIARTATGAFTPDQIERAREDVQWALAFTATVIERAEKQTMIDVMRRLQEETFSGFRDRTPPTSNGGRG